MSDEVEFKIQVGDMPATAWVEKQPVHPVKKILRCWCGEEMTSTGTALLSLPAQYPHKCPEGHATVVPHPTASYPHIAYD